MSDNLYEKWKYPIEVEEEVEIVEEEKEVEVGVIE